ncbi:MAG: asparagine synthase (glutamine-hydrolyzing) [Acidimicrobiales bacterium]
MCGIVGIRCFDGRPVDRDLLEAMTERVQHRGPDDVGVWVGGDVAFGHRRLSIIDVEGSRQPMGTGDGRFHIVFNGEIFNYRRLRERLRYRFATAGDTETILAAFADRGPASVLDLRGQFAYAVHDATDGSLWLFRDRVGVLPLYYHADGERLVFASEIKALLLALPDVAVDERSVETYLAHRAVVSPHTLFRGIKKLRPGHWLHVRRDGILETTRYWTLPSAGARGLDPAVAVDRVDAAVREAVDHALISDVGVGALLSGGVDSSLIVALMARARGGGGSVDTFSAGFGDPRSDELPFARQVSRSLGTRHHEVVVGPADFIALWSRLTWHRDGPISEPADIAVFRLAELARGSVKVLLSGEGSDELFAGYPKYQAERWVALAHAAPPRLRRWLATAADGVLPARFDRPRAVLRALGASDEWERHRAWFAPFDERGRQALLRRGAGVDRSKDSEGCGGGDPVDRLLRSDVRGWLADNLLERGDRMCMAAGVELRPPFLDHLLVELAFSLPTDVKVRHGRAKWVLKEVARRYLDQAIVDRPKVGFRVPLDDWFRTGLRAEAQARLLDGGSLARRLFNGAEVERLLADHRSGRRNEHMRIWTLLCLEVWHEAFFGGTAPPRR